MVSIDNSKEIPFKQDDTSLKGRKKEALQASVLLSELNYSGLKRFLSTQCPLWSVPYLLLFASILAQAH